MRVLGIIIVAITSIVASTLQAFLGVLLLGQEVTSGYTVSAGHLIAAISALFTVNGTLAFTIWSVLNRQVERANERADKYERLYLGAVSKKAEDSKGAP